MQLPTISRTVAALALCATSALIATGCGSSDDAADSDTSATSSKPLVVYSGREKELVEPLYEAFEKKTGIELDVRYGESPMLAAQLLEEGERSPADVFFAQDAGAVGSVSELLAELPDGVADDVAAEFKDPDDRWTGVTGRVRTLIYNTDDVKGSDLPASVLDVTDPAWKGRLGVAPTNSSFVAFVTALRQVEGEDAARAFLEDIAKNEPKTYEKNSQIVEAVAKGEVDAGLVNHYYLYEHLASNPDAPIKNHFFADGDVGNLVNVSAIGMLDSSKRADDAKTLIAYLLNEGQSFIVDAAEREYPLVVSDELSKNERLAELTPLASINGPDVDLGALGDELEASVEMIQESGLAS